MRRLGLRRRKQAGVITVIHDGIKINLGCLSSWESTVLDTWLTLARAGPGAVLAGVAAWQPAWFSGPPFCSHVDLAVVVEHCGPGFHLWPPRGWLGGRDNMLPIVPLGIDSAISWLADIAAMAWPVALA